MLTQSLQEATAQPDKAFYTPVKHLSKELQAISGMFLGYLQFHQAAWDSRTTISLLGWMIYED